MAATQRLQPRQPPLDVGDQKQGDGRNEQRGPSHPIQEQDKAAPIASYLDPRHASFQIQISPALLFA
ncbi:MAG TPA: hypothetical protein VHO25_04310, partial [Polyangiaceae bacterium]|nr:hypothetical protein [Polyangiaceae bacterium]